MRRQASSEAAWSLLTSSVAEARVEAHRLRHLVNRGLAIIEQDSPEQKEHVYQLAGDLIDAVPKRLSEVERLLDKTQFALAKMGEEFFSSRLSIDDKTEVNESVEHSRHPFSKTDKASVGRVTTAFLRKADLQPPLGRPGGPCHVVKRIDQNVQAPAIKEDLIDDVEVGNDLSNPEAQVVYSLEVEKGGGGWKQMAITPHAQYRMDLRGIGVGQVQKALSNLWTQMVRDPALKADVEYADRGFRWDDRQLRLSVVVVSKGSVATIVTAYPTGGSDPRPPGEGGCVL